MGAEFENEAEPTVSIKEYLQDVEDQELEVDLVLGGDDGKECTYDKGYMKRQAIFSCLTSTTNGNAGVCTACSLSCHDGHEIVELWTKRNIRCDCGNSKFGEFFCKLSSNKDVENAKNSYNHNFKGVYCTCSRPYPDPDVEDQVEMIQCCMCEDWFHEEHLGLESSDEIPRDAEGEPLYEDFICRACSAVCSFLTLYPRTIWAVGKLQVDVVNASKDKHVLADTPSACSSGTLESDLCANSTSAVEHIFANVDPASGSSCKESILGENSEKNMDSILCTKDVSAPATCVLGVDLVDASPVLDSKPMFVSKTWREMLCRCEKCIDFYNQKHIAFLLDKEDSIAEYEKMGKQKRDENLQQQEGAELSYLDNLGHVEKIEILNGIADMKNEIHTFLVEKHAETGSNLLPSQESFDPSKPIITADVHQVFENLAKKRRHE